MAAVRVVLPWSTWPMVPMLRCGLVRTYAVLGMAHSLEFEAEREDPRAPPTLPLRGPPDCRGGSASGAADGRRGSGRRCRCDKCRCGDGVHGSLRRVRDCGLRCEEGVPEHGSDHGRRAGPRRMVFRGARDGTVRRVGIPAPRRRCPGPRDAGSAGRCRRSGPCRAHYGDHTRASVSLPACSTPPPPPPQPPGPPTASPCAVRGCCSRPGPASRCSWRCCWPPRRRCCSSNPNGCSPPAGPPSSAVARSLSRCSVSRTACARWPSCRGRCSISPPVRSSVRRPGWPPRWWARCSARASRSGWAGC